MHHDREKSHSHGTREHSGHAAALALNALTPAILVAGLLVLIVYHFGSTLAGFQQQQAQANSIVGFSVGNLAIQLHRNRAGGRPEVLYNGETVLSYDDALSVITLDGQRQEVWNGDHGYSLDVNKRQIFSTSSGANWQVVQITQLVNDHTVSVSYNLAIHGRNLAELHQVVVQVTHVQHVWANPQVNGNTFSAIALPPPPPALANALVRPIGTIQVQAGGPYLVNGALVSSTQQSSSTESPAITHWATTFTTTYQVNQPQAETLIALGTETITFDPSTNAPSVVFPDGG